MQTEDADASAACGEGILKGLGGALEHGGGLGFVDGDLGAPRLRVVHLFVVDQSAAGIDDRDRHEPIILFGFGESGGSGFFGGVDGNGRSVRQGRRRRRGPWRILCVRGQRENSGQSDRGQLCR